MYGGPGKQPFFSPSQCSEPEDHQGYKEFSYLEPFFTVIDMIATCTLSVKKRLYGVAQISYSTIREHSRPFFCLKDILLTVLTDSTDFQKFLNYFNSDFDVPSRRSFMRQLSQKGKYMADEIAELHEEFGITRKVITTTTDNRGNYISAFANQGPKEKRSICRAPTPQSLSQTLWGMRRTPHPKHRRCSDHTVNLLKSKNIDDMSNWYVTPCLVFKKPSAKVQGIWNTQNRKTFRAANIMADFNWKLMTSCVSCWNSRYAP
ncbi:unnamed protein product [Lepeophtheirus salmonis]|uniref:(salmon louse) hypothetical protein n=1 Tax=Lepeophtheirus salmonis TaxID=72036 RepID=A0A7R8GZN2_LEPSM|nr:unnamed protein product [Lepeophtheirus salmonis]CAF2769742.1 unnamed protein product [Lepeophtheirus salmonis]